MTDYTREVARLDDFDIGSDDHGGLALIGSFNFGGSAQGLGYRVDMDFVQRFMGVFRVERLQDVNGKHAWVTHSNFDISKIEPLLPGEGEAFDIHAWSAEKRKGK